MVAPLDIVLIFHNGFRRKMAEIDAAALAAGRGQGPLAEVTARSGFYNEILLWHAHAEEQSVFPAVNAVLPEVAEPYLRDHGGLDRAAESLDAAVATGDALEAARASAAFKFHLDIHLDKEDTHLYPLLRTRTSADEQARVFGILASSVPQARFSEAVGWLIPMLSVDERETLLRIWQMVMPPQVLGFARQLVQKSAGSGWAELVQRMPELG